MPSGRCPVCPGTNRCVPGDGPLPCRLVFVGERPGKDEDDERRGGRPFTGRAGLEFNKNYLTRVLGIPREEVYVTNAVKCRDKGGDKAPSEQLLDMCSYHFLRKEIERANPEVVVLMGGTACMLVPWLRVDLHHGRPFKTQLWGKERVIFPTFHPALGLHQTVMIQELREDFRGLREYLEGKREKGDGGVRVETVVAEGGRGVRRELKRESTWEWMGRKVIALDTERWKGRLWSVQFTVDGERGVVVRAEDAEGMRVLRESLNAGRWFVLLHFGMQDSDWLRTAGVEIDMRPDRYTDTASLAYRMGMPQALKTIGFRLFGHDGKGYEELVEPASLKRMKDWLLRAREEAVKHRIKTGKRVRTLKPTNEEKLIDRALFGKKGVFEKVGKWPEEIRETVEAWAEEEVPEEGIGLVEEGEAMEYAAADPVLTWRAAMELMRRGRERDRGIWKELE